MASPGPLLLCMKLVPEQLMNLDGQIEWEWKIKEKLKQSKIKQNKQKSKQT